MNAPALTFAPVPGIPEIETGDNLGAVLAEIPWQRSDTRRALLAALSSRGFDVIELEPLQDLDEPRDLEAWLASRPMSRYFLGIRRRLRQLLALAGVGLFAFGGQIFMTWAYRYAEASFVSAFTYATVLFSAVLGFVFFGEVPGPQAMAGAVVIVVAGVTLSLLKARSIASAR